jgi:hypothetical protein
VEGDGLPAFLVVESRKHGHLVFRDDGLMIVRQSER